MSENMQNLLIPRVYHIAIAYTGYSIRRYFQGATWQECQTHFMRNILDKTPKVLQKEIHAKVRAIFEAPYAKTARMVLNKY